MNKPLKVTDGDGGYHARLLDAFGNPVADVLLIREANEIAKIVNSHDELVKVCEKTLVAIEGSRLTLGGIGELRAAIAIAKEE